MLYHLYPRQDRAIKFGPSAIDLKGWLDSLAPANCWLGWLTMQESRSGDKHVSWFENVKVCVCVYIYIYHMIKYKYIYAYTFLFAQTLLQTQLILFPSPALWVVKPASSQDLLWVAGHSSLTSLPGPPGWDMSNTLTCILLRTHSQNWCYFASRHLSQNNMAIKNDQCKPKPSKTWCTYIYIYNPQDLC